MRVTIASGKGGTGKTTIATSLALAWGNATLLDCDVEGPNAHLLLRPKIRETVEVSVPVPRLVSEACSYCGVCSDFCRYHALAVVPGKWMVFDQLCHSCGGCTLVCPTQAIHEVDRRIGEVRHGTSGKMKFVQGELDEGEAHAVPVIEAVLKAGDDGKDVIIDSPPGCSCPMIAAAEAADIVLLVTEPTPFGLHDLKMAVTALKEIDRPAGIVINRADWGAGEVGEYAESEGIPVVLEIPHLLEVAQGYARSRPLVESAPQFRQKMIDLRPVLASLFRERAA